MHLRRALLLFAIVLGLAALVTSISRTPTERSDRDPAGSPAPTQTTPQTTPVENDPTERSLLFDTAGKPTKRELEVGRNATVFVETDETGRVDIAGLGLTAPAEPGTPAAFEVLENDPGRHVIWFTPSTGAESRRVGVLQIVAG